MLALNQEIIKKEILDGMNKFAVYASRLDELDSQIVKGAQVFKHDLKHFNKDLILRTNEQLWYYPVYEDDSLQPVLLDPTGSVGNQYKSDLPSLRFQR